MASLLQFPRPRSFLHLISLRTATEFIAFSLAINKVTGLYGILAIFTGFHLNTLQLSHYIYSLLVLALVAYLSPAIRRRDEPLKVIGLAWLYVLDSIVNSIYTTLFGAGWFILLAQHVDTPGSPGMTVPGVGMMNDTAGFTSPEHTVGQVEVVATPAPGAVMGQEAVAYGTNAMPGALGGAIFQSDSMASLSVLALLCVLRLYFCIIILSHARAVLRRYVASTSGTSFQQSDDVTMAENPFRVGRDEGAGWRGKIGRFMVRFPTKRYWLGRDESEDEWMRATSGRFEAGKGLRVQVPKDNGVGERERRARSGTGPPVPLSLPVGKKVPQ